jgi:hypothetical protein
MRLNALQTFWVRVAARDAAFLGYKVLSRPLQSEDFNFNALKVCRVVLSCLWVVCRMLLVWFWCLSGVLK